MSLTKESKLKKTNRHGNVLLAAVFFSSSIGATFKDEVGLLLSVFLSEMVQGILPRKKKTIAVGQKKSILVFKL